MDLNAANQADERAVRLTRASMITCFVIASVMLLASLAMAKSANVEHSVNILSPASAIVR